MMKDYCDYGKLTFHITLTQKKIKKIVDFLIIICFNTFSANYIFNYLK